MTEPEAVVRRFFDLLIDREAAAAAELLADDVEWRNTGFPTIRGGRRVGGILRDMERRRISFSAGAASPASFMAAAIAADACTSP